ncbi:MAG TPA: hypothetical protein VJN63_04800 [Thermoplasmata archaeon]|nr:hypothetical protein [Thermoplasmata archaeon]
MRDAVSVKRDEYRLKALARSAIRDRHLSPEESLEIGFELIESARRLSDAAEASLVRRRR